MLSRPIRNFIKKIKNLFKPEVVQVEVSKEASQILDMVKSQKRGMPPPPPPPAPPPPPRRVPPIEAEVRVKLARQEEHRIERLAHEAYLRQEKLLAQQRVKVQPPRQVKKTTTVTTSIADDDVLSTLATVALVEAAVDSFSSSPSTSYSDTSDFSGGGGSSGGGGVSGDW